MPSDGTNNCRYTKSIARNSAHCCSVHWTCEYQYGPSPICTSVIIQGCTRNFPMSIVTWARITAATTVGNIVSTTVCYKFVVATCILIFAFSAFFIIVCYIVSTGTSYTVSTSLSYVISSFSQHVAPWSLSPWNTYENHVCRITLKQKFWYVYNTLVKTT